MDQPAPPSDEAFSEGPDGLVVGIGASAGGLEALKTFLAATPPAPGYALVLVQHLGEADQELMADVISRLTPLPVALIEDGTEILADRLLIAPADAIVQVKEGRLRLRPPRSPSERRNPIDRFFQTLADGCGPKAVGVVLSGSGSDGALGLAAIGAAGGMTMAQAPATAAFADMPAYAGAADHVLPPDDLARTLAAYAQSWRKVAAGSGRGDRRREIQARLGEICDVLNRRTGHDFKHYKATTLIRRLERRMQVRGTGDVDAYVGELARDLAEPHTLFRELLIGVTSFFREPEAFAALGSRVIATLLEERGPTEQLRIWAPGCATGEEAYSIAMLVREQLDRIENPPRVQIFATDVNERALATARRGSYPQGIAAHVSPERLARFFHKRGRRYQVTDELREMCLFSVHNLISDPPFSRLDLISCRNLLIYLGSHLQKKLIPVFHYALRSGGCLFLGASESLTGHGELFRVIDAKHRIAQRKDTPIHVPGQLREFGAAGVTGVRGGAPVGEADLGAVAQRILLDEFTPRYAIVTEDGQLVFLSEGADLFVQTPAGSYTNNIMRMARRGLSVGLRTAFNQAVRTRRPVVREIPLVQTAEGPRAVRLTAQPMPELGRDDGLVMLVFQDLGQPARRSEEAVPHPDADAVVEALERELLRTREDLERTVQDLEAANEELKSSNEELLSMNEELQSANEELETSKEEVQAANQALAAANADLENLLRSTRIATIFLDRDGAIRGFTPAATEVYNIAQGDVGRPLSHFTHRLIDLPPMPDPSLLPAEEGVDDEARGAEGRWYLRRVLPYRAPEGAFDGLVVTFTEVTRQKESEQTLARLQRRQTFLLALNDRLRALVDPEAITAEAAAMLGGFLDVARVGYGEIDEAQEHVIVVRDHHDGRLGSVAGTHRLEGFGREIIAALKLGETVRVADVAEDPRTNPDALVGFAAIGTRSVLAVPLVKNGRFVACLYLHHPEPRAWSEEDASLAVDVAERSWAAVERARALAALKESEGRFRSMADSAPVLIWVTDQDGGCEFVNRAYLDFFGKRLDEVMGFAWTPNAHPEDEEAYVTAYLAANAAQAPFSGEARFRRGDGEVRWLRSDGLPRLDPVNGAFLGYIGSSVDVTDLKRVEATSRETADRLSLALYAAHMGDWSWDAASGIIALSERGSEILGLLPERQTTWAKLREIIHPADAERARVGLETAMANFDDYASEFRVRRPSDGAEVWVAANGLGTYAPNGHSQGMIGVIADVTSRKAAEERQALLVRELHHRVKNTLATVQAIVGSTARTASSIDEFYEGFVGRIVSMAHTHSLLTEDAWQTALLTEILWNELKPYEDGSLGRVSLDGPAVELPSDIAVPMGMAVHELTTNAAKYGSLSARGGQVRISWRILDPGAGQRLHFEWVERGGPPVEAPKRQGFGSRLLQRVLGAQLQAVVTIDFEPEGLRFRMEAPLPDRGAIMNPLIA